MFECVLKYNLFPKWHEFPALILQSSVLRCYIWPCEDSDLNLTLIAHIASTSQQRSAALQR